MQAVVFNSPGDISLEVRPVPTIQDARDAIVKVRYSGLCGSELHVFRGHQPSDTGFIMGHEFTGVVTDVGNSVASVRVGDKVVCPFTVSCGKCFYCLLGKTSRCERSLLFGSSALDGGQAEYVRVPLADGSLVKAPVDVPDEVLILMADIFPTGYFAASTFLKDLPPDVRESSVNVVVGCGPVGLCAIVAAKSFVKTVYAIDSVASRLQQAELLGAIPIHLHDSPREKILAATNQRGADVVMEIVGLPPALRLAFDLIRPWGRIASVGVHNAEIPFSAQQAYNKNVMIQFGRCPVRALFTDALALLRREQEKLKILSDCIMPLSEAKKGYEAFDKMEVQKVIFDLSR